MEAFKLSYVLGALALVTISPLLMQPATAAGVGLKLSQPPPVGPPEGPEPYPGFNNLYKRCMLLLTQECASETWNALFDKSKEVSIKCCIKLVAIGPDCHEGLLKALLLLPGLTDKDKDELKERDSSIWSECRDRHD